ncbi:MAG: amidase family protein, partial [Actinomycetes bacterium]
MSGVVQAAEAVRRGETTPSDLVAEALAVTERATALNVFAHLDAEHAHAQASRLTEEARRGEYRGPLHGVPMTVKDLFSVDGVQMRGGTRAPLPAGLGAGGDAVAVARLRDAGAVVLGTTNMVEIALGIHGENPWTGDVCNPYDPACQTGGSSSGSAAAVAIGAGLASLGSDTAGSVRIPAALCG